MVRGLTRKRPYEIADPVRKLGQDLVRFVLRRRPVHARLAALVARVTDTRLPTNKFDFYTFQAAICLLVVSTLRMGIVRNAPWIINPWCLTGNESRTSVADSSFPRRREPGNPEARAAALDLRFRARDGNSLETLAPLWVSLLA
jgi:hypothetical protein